MKKLWIDFLKGTALFVIGSLSIGCILYGLLTYLEANVFGGEIPHTYRMIAVGIAIALVYILIFLTMMKPARAIQLEKDRRITQWGITGVRPEDQETDEEEQ